HSRTSLGENLSMKSVPAAWLRPLALAMLLVAPRLVLLPAHADAGVPGTMTYQGRLGGASVLPDSVNMTFRIFAAPTGGTALWSEDHEKVYVDATGLFEVSLGGLTASSFPSDGSTPYLEIVVNGETLAPRRPLNSVPYAFVAATSAGPHISTIVAG